MEIKAPQYKKMVRSLSVSATDAAWLSRNLSVLLNGIFDIDPDAVISFIDYSEIVAGGKVRSTAFLIFTNCDQEKFPDYEELLGKYS